MFKALSQLFSATALFYLIVAAIVVCLPEQHATEDDAFSAVIVAYGVAAIGMLANALVAFSSPEGSFLMKGAGGLAGISLSLAFHKVLLDQAAQPVLYVGIGMFMVIGAVLLRRRAANI